MKLYLLKDLSLRDLKNNIDKNNYNNIYPFANDFLKEKGRNNYLEELPGDFNDVNLIISSNPKDDVKNSKIIYENFKNLLPIYARNEKLWTYLTHFVFWDYMRERWFKNPNINIESRYFFKGKTKDDVISVSSLPYTRNGIGRLWWGAYIVYNKELDNPYEYLEELFASQDLFVGICERSFSKNKKLTTSILKKVREYNLNNISNSVTIIREILKEINFISAITIFDVLTENEVDNIIDEIIQEKLKEYSK